MGGGWASGLALWRRTDALTPPTILSVCVLIPPAIDQPVAVTLPPAPPPLSAATPPPPPHLPLTPDDDDDQGHIAPERAIPGSPAYPRAAHCTHCLVIAQHDGVEQGGVDTETSNLRSVLYF